jgi:hypothetical protein
VCVFATHLQSADTSKTTITVRRRLSLRPRHQSWCKRRLAPFTVRRRTITLHAITTDLAISVDGGGAARWMGVGLLM